MYQRRYRYNAHGDKQYNPQRIVGEINQLGAAVMETGIDGKPRLQNQEKSRKGVYKYFVPADK
jgi:hypothetical protein